MITLPEYINQINENMRQASGDGSAVFNPGVSNAIICCYQIMARYADARRIKNIPAPVMVMNKNIESQDCYTLLKFNTNAGATLHADILYNIIEQMNLSQNIQLSEFGATLNMEIYN